MVQDKAIFTMADQQIVIIWSIERRNFQCPWMTPNPDFKVTPLFNAKYLRDGTRYRHGYNEILIETHALLTHVVSNDLEWLSKIFNVTKHRAVSVRRLSFLLLRTFVERKIRIKCSKCASGARHSKTRPMPPGESNSIIPVPMMLKSWVQNYINFANVPTNLGDRKQYIVGCRWEKLRSNNLTKKMYA